MAQEYKYGELDNWDEVEVKTGSEFMKLVEGDNVVRIITKPYQFSVAWIKNQKGTHKVRSAMTKDCPLVKAGEKLQNRWYVGVFERKTKTVKILEISGQIVSSIKKLALDEDWGNPRDYDVNIVRGAPDSQPLYTVIAKPKKPLTDDEKAQVARFNELTDLKKMTTPPLASEVEERLAAISGNAPKQDQSRGSNKVPSDLFNFDDE
jgi:hypothetical protein